MPTSYTSRTIPTTIYTGRTIPGDFVYYTWDSTPDTWNTATYTWDSAGIGMLVTTWNGRTLI